ncbi:hypothetical protein ACLBWP_16945 [Microbacterium sp. M1A1_1b]
MIALAISVGLFFGLNQLSFQVALTNVLVAVVIAGALGLVGSGWAMVGLATVFFLGPLMTRFLLTGAELSIRAWFMGLLAGWVLGALVRRRLDKNLPAQRRTAGPVLRWWVKGKQFEQESPTAAQVEAKIRALDGVRRTLVMVIHDKREIDVCGNANDRLIVFRTEDSTDENAWELPHSDVLRSGESVEIAMGNVSAPVSRGLTLDPQSAIRAADTFLTGKKSLGEDLVQRGVDVLRVRPSLP